MGDTKIDTTNAQAVQQFITRWRGVTTSELATAQSFVLELCALLDLPLPTHEPDYMFERPITFLHGDGSSSAGRIDCYRRGHFVLEAKKLKNNAPAKGFDDALLHARALPATLPNQVRAVAAVLVNASTAQPLPGSKAEAPGSPWPCAARG